LAKGRLVALVAPDPAFLALGPDVGDTAAVGEALLPLDAGMALAGFFLAPADAGLRGDFLTGFDALFLAGMVAPSGPTSGPSTMQASLGADIKAILA